MPSTHSTPIHVPWRNSGEWKNVHMQLFHPDSTREDMRRALHTLELWKSRMPRLYSGIEGTIIILKGLLKGEEAPEDDARLLKSSAVMRFLNVCLASSLKNQETFFNIAKTRNLPDWIVNVRHEYTHSQKIPSTEILNRAIDYLLMWLKVNYWDPQSILIEDYVPNVQNKNQLMTLINLYEKVAVTNRHSVISKLSNKLRKFNVQMDKSKYVVLQRIADALMSNNNFTILNAPDLIIKNGAIFNFTEMIVDNYIDENVVKSWMPFINVLNHYSTLLQLLRIFIEICCKNENKDRATKSAAWLKTIFKLGVEEYPNLFLIENNHKTILKNFVVLVISKKNSYTSIYLRELLTLAKCDKKFIINACRGIEALVPKPRTTIPTRIYTIHDVKDFLSKKGYNNFDRGITMNNTNWKVVNDGSFLNGLPLGSEPLIIP